MSTKQFDAPRKLSFDTKATRRTRAIKRPASTFSNSAKIGTRCPTMAVRSEIPDARARAVVVVVVVVVQRLSAARQQLAVALAPLSTRQVRTPFSSLQTGQVWPSGHGFRSCMRNDTESRNDDPDDRQAGDRHSSSPLRQVRPVRRVDCTKLIKGTLRMIFDPKGFDRFS
jgi:hypothetical protein